MNRIKEVLLDQGRSQLWLAGKTGIRYTIITNYCNNRTQPSKPVFDRIARILDVPVSSLRQE
ncbi:MAG TPA: helix-turn-helix transcriptional regulator [Bacteroidia bacterium]|jgi:transcriptional regulator with XRE-family HTH domain|nr:helix-turn-helix transcriptional regulator [Bacteroidia bacterium]